MLQVSLARVAFEFICRTSCLSDRNNGLLRSALGRSEDDHMGTVAEQAERTLIRHECPAVRVYVCRSTCAIIVPWLGSTLS